MSNYSPLILFLYNRPYQTINTINYLKQNPIHKNTDIIIFSDGYKKGDFKMTEFQANRILTLPINQFLTNTIFLYWKTVRKL